MQSTKSNVAKHHWVHVVDMFFIWFVFKIVKVIEVLHDLPIYETFGILKNSLKQFCETNISLWHDFFWCPWDVKCLRSRPALVTTYFFSSFTCALLSMVSWCKLGKINFCHRKVLTTVYQFNWIMSLIFRVNALLQKRVYSPIPSF